MPRFSGSVRDVDSIALSHWPSHPAHGRSAPAPADRGTPCSPHSACAPRDRASEGRRRSTPARSGRRRYSGVWLRRALSHDVPLWGDAALAGRPLTPGGSFDPALQECKTPGYRQPHRPNGVPDPARVGVVHDQPGQEWPSSGRDRPTESKDAHVPASFVFGRQLGRHRLGGRRNEHLAGGDDRHCPIDFRPRRSVNAPPSTRPTASVSENNPRNTPACAVLTCERQTPWRRSSNHPRTCTAAYSP